MAITLVLHGASMRVVRAQAPIWDLGDRAGSAEQWSVYGRDNRAGLLGMPETAGDFNGDGFSDIAMAGTRTDIYLIFSDGLGGEFNLLSIDPADDTFHTKQAFALFHKVIFANLGDWILRHIDL